MKYLTPAQNDPNRSPLHGEFNMEAYIGRSKPWFTTFILFGLALVLIACTTPETTTPPPVAECPTLVVPTPQTYDELWATSPHADKTAPAFTHWDETNPQEIPAECAQCHSRSGFLDFLGVDGSAQGIVDAPAKTGSVITCYVCHNEGSLALDYVNFSSGRRVGGLGPEAWCINCHQGRASTISVVNAIAAANLPTDDTPGADLLFINSHSISGATPFGSEAQGAYQYDGKTYLGRYMRGEDFFPCIQCHNQHTLELNLSVCSECHTFDGGDVKNIRVNTTDFDGDGDITEGAYYEVDQLHANLLSVIQAYAINITKVPIAYSLDLHPYFFIDTNNNGTVDPEELNADNKYNAWTPRLLRAAYNYNYVSHDPGAFAHNPRYILQVLYDSLQDMGADMAGLARP
jgi:hypothetical protein